MKPNQRNVITEITKDDDWFLMDGVSYKTMVEICQVGILNHCMCGEAEANLRLVRDTFRRYELDWDDPVRKELYVLRDDPKFAFLLYELDAAGFTEHGISFPGWLTDEGKKFLKLLNALDLE